MVSCCSGGLAVRRAAAWSYVFGVHLVGFDLIELPVDNFTKLICLEITYYQIN
jgi:hypothetical protein